jgi:hypothetical protein
MTTIVCVSDLHEHLVDIPRRAGPAGAMFAPTTQR